MSTSEIRSRETPFGRATLALTKRWVVRLKREKTGLFVALIQPAVWLILFGHLFSDAAVVTTHSYIAFMTAGVVIMTVFNGALNGGVELLFDKETGMLKRLVAAPIPPASILASRFLFVVALTSAQALIILLIAMLLGVGISSGIVGLGTILVVGLLLGIGITAVSMALAFGLYGHGQFFSIIEFVSLPLIFASNALVPLEKMPTWLQWIAHVNPMTYAIGSVRTLILEGFHLSVMASTAGVLLVFDVAMILLCLWTMGRALD